jgi:hypothetical protein
MEKQAFQVPDTAASEKGDRANNSVAAQHCCTLHIHVFVYVQGGSNMTGNYFFLNHNCQTL